LEYLTFKSLQKGNHPDEKSRNLRMYANGTKVEALQPRKTLIKGHSITFEV
jgi:hypothetical protein